MNLRLPVIITNFKAYESSVGKKGLELARIHARVAEETGASLAVAVQKSDIRMIASEVNIPVIAQHIDPVTYGARTGHVVPEVIYEAGALGTLLNHSEKRVPPELLEASIKRAQEAGLFFICCAESPDEAEKIFRFGADLIAYEPPELIGGNISVSHAKPEYIKEAVERVGEDKLLCGAGVKTREDIVSALRLGAVGVLLASGVTKAENPELVLKDLVSGLQT